VVALLGSGRRDTIAIVPNSIAMRAVTTNGFIEAIIKEQLRGLVLADSVGYQHLQLYQAVHLDGVLNRE
jgi:hypothetical protein